MAAGGGQAFRRQDRGRGPGNIVPIPGVNTFQADITSESTVEQVKEALGGMRMW